MTFGLTFVFMIKKQMCISACVVSEAVLALFIVYTLFNLDRYYAEHTT